MLLFLGYSVGYPLAVLPPILIDPLLKSHVVYGARIYPDAPFFCSLIYIVSLPIYAALLVWAKDANRLYISVFVFIASIVASLPFFFPEFPHGNLFAVGSVTAFSSAFSIFVWSVGEKIYLNNEALDAAGPATFEYVKALFTFVRQAAFAGVALFGALFFAAFSTEFSYAKDISSDLGELFWLHINISMQITFYAFYLVGGVVRYFFTMTLIMLLQFRFVASKLDGGSKNPLL